MISEVVLDGCSGGDTGSVSASEVDSTQQDNAQVIYDVPVSLRLPQQAAVIAVATAMQESRLQN
jgi:hypothetical protein